jgi:superfamily II DNA or RNA helicase
MLYLPTGGGKTEIAISMMKHATEKGRRAAMVMDRRVLADQTSQRLDRYEVDHGVLMAGHPRYRPTNPLQVCTVQTLEKRGGFPLIDLLIVDEAHMSRRSIINYITQNPEVKVVGLSATPFTKGLGEIYSNVVSTSSTNALMKEGNLVPLRVFITTETDMSSAHKKFGEWTDKDATAAGIRITGDVVQEWTRIAHEVFGRPEKTLVNAAGVAHGRDLARGFGEAGYNFVAISYKDSDEYKAEVLAEFRKPDSSIHGVIATDILTKGFDQADVRIGISARPFSKSISSHIQQMGRVMRPFPGKEFAVWIDHSGNYLRFLKQWGEIAEFGVHELDDGAEKVMPEPTEYEKKECKCPKCKALWGPTDVCASCGHVRIRTNDVVTVQGTAAEYVEPKEIFSSAFKERWYQELLGFGSQKGYPTPWAYYRYIEKFNIKPCWKQVYAEPSQELLGWLTSRQIAYRYNKKRAA